MRIEDTDRERSTQAAIDAILEAMDWLGLDYDEGPIYQTHRLARYQEMAEQLVASGHASVSYTHLDVYKRQHDGLARMALVPRVLEARGLDVTPGMIVKLRGLGDHATADILELILREEIAHVAAGSRWYRWYCERAGVCLLYTSRCV